MKILYYRSLFIITALVLLSITGVYGQQNAVLYGEVTDTDNGEGLIGANVQLMGTNWGAATNVDGNYRITRITPGTYTLVISYLGYQRQEIEIELAAGEELEYNSEMTGAGIEGEEILFSVQAQGQRSAINQQLSSNTISNIVSRDRIREMPDVNAAESIGRLPGVSIQRSGGEANKIAIRGLSPKYNTVTVNGVRMPATGGDDRSVDLSLISSNMLDGIEVLKAITPDQDADAIGGSVDLRLREAPDQLMFDVAAQGGFTHLQNHYGNYKLTGSVSNRFLDNKLGVIANINLDEYDRSADKFSGDYRRSTNSETGETEVVAQSIGLREENVVRGRKGASIVLDYRIPHGKINANTFYNKLDNDGLYRINRMDVNANRHYYDLERRTGSTSVMVGGIGFEQDFDWINYDANVSRTSTSSNNPRDYTYHFVQESSAFQGSVTPGTDPNQIPGMATNDSTDTALQDLYTWGTDRNEHETAAQANFHIPFNLGSTIDGEIQFGGKLRWLDRMNDETQYGRGGLHYGMGTGDMSEILQCVDEQVPEWGIAESVAQYGHLPMNTFFDDYSREGFLNGEYPLGWVADEQMMNTMAQTVEDCGHFIDMALGSRGRDYEGIERYQAGYLMTEINFGDKVTLLPGVRWEGDYSRYYGQRYREVVRDNIQQEPQELDSLTTERDHSYLLPMVHLRYFPTSWMDIRLARTETLTRPDYMQYAPITTMNSYRDYIRAANSTLTPARSVNYDASISFYNNELGLFTVSGFHKKIDDLVFQVNYRLRPEIGALEGTNIPEEWVEYNPRSDTHINNSFPAYYRGIELDWQTNFWYLPSVFKGLVLNVNYTHIFSETEYQRYAIKQEGTIPGTMPPMPNQVLVDTSRIGRMPDQPRHIANITLGYDYKGFSGRLSFLYQTDTMSWIAAEPALDNISGEYARFDLMLRQDIFEGLQVYTNLNNLNNRADRNFQGSATQNPTYTEYYGFTMDMGIRYKF